MGKLGQTGSRAVIMSLLRGSPVLDGIADVLWTACEGLGNELREVEQAAREEAEAEAARAEAGADAPSSEALHAAMLAEGAFVLSFGGTPMFYEGLDGFLGMPAIDLELGMYQEHCEALDADVRFIAPNYGTETTSRQEYWFVADPIGGLDKVGLSQWPATPSARNDGTMSDGRMPHPPAHFEPAWRKINAGLHELNERPLDMAGFVGLRLYTGPMYVKYNTLLRAASGCVPALRKRSDEMCLTNTYASTLSIITSAIAKMGKMMPACKVFRAPGGALPPSFFHADTFGVLGGVEPAFMSTT
eukprot:5146893-Prymnesium_polylepis.1